MHIRFFTLFIVTASLTVSAMDHFYAFRGGLGISGLLGSDVPKNSEIGLSGSIGAVGASAFYPAGPLWGTDLSVSILNVKKDTVLWSNESGDNTDSTQYTLSFGRISMGLFLMKSWDFGLSIYTGPLGSYQFSCSKSWSGESEQCDEEYQPFLMEVEIGMMQQVSERISVELRYLQTVLPFDVKMKRKEYTYAANLGLLFQF